MKNTIYTGQYASNLLCQSEKGLGHSLSPTGIDLMRDWLQKRFKEMDGKKDVNKSEKKSVNVEDL